MSDDIRDLSFKDFLSLVNKHDEHHSSDAYKRNATLEHLNRDSRIVSEGESKSVIQNLKRNDVEFQVYEHVFDKTYNNYCKRLPDDSDYLRDEKGGLVYYTHEEKIALLGENRYAYEHSVVRKDTGEIVAETSDDWNCLLYLVAKEYQGFGLANVLLEKQQERHPYRHTGGFTPNGENGYRRFYTSQIRKAMRDGYYSRSVREGRMSKDRCLDILKSADVYNWIKYDETIQSSPEYKKNVLEVYGLTNSDLEKDHNYLNTMKIRSTSPESFAVTKCNYCKPENLVLYVDGGTAILYDKNIYEQVIDDRGIAINNEFFFEQAIKGYVHNGGVMTSDTPERIYGLYAINEAVEKYMHVVALNLSLNEELIVDRDQLHLIKELPLADKLEFGDYIGKTTVKLKEPTFDLKPLAAYESLVRKNRDNKYGDKFCVIHERAYGIAESHKNEIRFYEAPELSFEEKLQQHRSRPAISSPPLNNAVQTRKAKTRLTL